MPDASRSVWWEIFKGPHFFAFLAWMVALVGSTLSLVLGGTGSGLLSAWVALSLALVLGLELFMLWQRRYEGYPSRGSGPSGYTEDERFRRMGDVRRATACRLIGVGLLFGSALALLLFGQPLSSQPDKGVVTVRFSAPVEAGLANSRVTPPAGPGQTVPREVTVRPDPDLAKALRAFLRPTPMREGGLSLGVLIIMGFLVVAVAIVVGMLVAKDPSATPMAAAATLAGGMIAASLKLPPLVEGGFRYWLFWGVAVVLFLLPGMLLLFPRGRLLVGISGDGSKEASPVLIYSIPLLILGMSMVFVGAHGGTAVQKPQASPHGAAPPDVVVLPLPTVGGFAPLATRSSELALQALVGRLDTLGVGKGDSLLLLGSADCTSVAKKRKGVDNKILAQERAKWVRREVLASEDGKLSADQVVPTTLAQYSGCKAAGALRAVFPFLLRPKQARESPRRRVPARPTSPKGWIPQS